MPTSCSKPAEPGAASPEGSGLWVVMPVYNEAAALPVVVAEWLPVLEGSAGDVTLCLIDDGSTDSTPAVLQRLARDHSQIEVVTKANTGHGRTCLYGYRLALERGARWILQIDSDGQCNPAGFAELWDLRAEAPVVFGVRRVREDGRWRRPVSRLLALGTGLATGVWVRDPNVPYRLMKAAALQEVIDDVPGDIDLVNVYVAVALEARVGIRWIDIVFRERVAGRSHRSWRGMLRPGLDVMARLARDRDRIRRLRAGRGEAHRLDPRR